LTAVVYCMCHGRAPAVICQW